MYLEADYKWKKGRAKKESWIAPRKKSRAKRRKTVAPKKKKKPSRQGKKKSRQKKKHPRPPPKKRTVSPRKKSHAKKKTNQLAPKKISRQGKKYSRIYMCVAPIFVSWFELVRIWSMHWKVKSESVWCLLKCIATSQVFLLVFMEDFWLLKLTLNSVIVEPTEWTKLL